MRSLKALLHESFEFTQGWKTSSKRIRGGRAHVPTGNETKRKHDRHNTPLTDGRESSCHRGLSARLEEIDEKVETFRQEGGGGGHGPRLAVLQTDHSLQQQGNTRRRDNTLGYQGAATQMQNPGVKNAGKNWPRGSVRFLVGDLWQLHFPGTFGGKVVSDGQQVSFLGGSWECFSPHLAVHEKTTGCQM